MKQYTPIACSVHDHIEAAIVKQLSGTIVYKNELGAQFQFRGKAKDWQTRNSTEYLILDNDTEVRGDQIVNFMGIEVSEGYCAM